MPAPPAALKPEHVDALARELIETLPCGVVHVRADGSIANANAEALRILGLKLDALTQRYTVDFETETLHEDGSPCPASEYPVSRALATGLAQPAMTIGVRHPNANVAWAVFRATPILEPGTGTLRGAVVTFLDITERKLAEDAVREHREQLRKAQELAKIGSWSWDLTSGRVQWSDEMYRIYGDPDFDGTLQRAMDRVHPDDVTMMRARMQRVVEGAAQSGSMYRLLRPDGSEVTVWGTGEITRDAHGRAIKMIGTVQDVTDQRRLEEKVRAAQRLETVGRLAGGVAHDFNNLLQVILANVDGGLHHGAPIQALHDIGLAAERAIALTKQLLALGRRSPFRAVPFDPSETMQELLRLLPRLLGERVRIELELAPQLPAVHGDSHQLLQVLINLCINARDAMPKGGRLRIGAGIFTPEREFLEHHAWATAPAYVAVTVADDGVGMEPSVLAQVFEPFFTTKADTGGSGLGLAVAYGIVQQHGGHIEAESQLGLGSTFRLYLPAREQTAPVSTKISENDARAAARNTARIEGGFRVLVVEDEPLVRDVLVTQLRRAGLDVLIASDGVRALELYDACAADRRDIELVLSDIQMPKLDGYELTEQLHRRCASLPVVLITGAADAPAPERFENPPIVLHKPISPQLLLETLRKLLVT